MDFQRVIDMIKDIVPFAVWGCYDFQSERRTHKSFGLFGDNQLSFFDENVQKFDALVDCIWEEKNLYDLPRKDIEDFILAVIIAIHENTFKNDDTLQKSGKNCCHMNCRSLQYCTPFMAPLSMK